MLFRDVINQLLDEHGLTYAGTAEKTYLSSLEVRFQKVYHLYTGIKHLAGCAEFFELRRLAVNRQGIRAVQFRKPVDRVSCDIHNPSPDLFSPRHSDIASGGDYFHTSAKSVCGIHRHAANGVFTYVLLNFYDKLGVFSSVHLQGFVYGRECVFTYLGKVKVYVHHRTYNL